jgi:formylglycine-generating enzyme required for sulfatase activity
LGEYPAAEPACSIGPVNTDGMVLLNGGEFRMGTNESDGYPSDGEGPIRTVRMRPFWIDAEAVSNARFAAFVDPTGYVTEAERQGWSFIQMRYPWGNQREPDGEHRMNVWQGSLPAQNSLDDGFLGTAPVRAIPPNEFGLYNMTGNVWEWCADWFSPTFHFNGPRNNPRGPRADTHRVMRGGSYLCHESYCYRYRVAARSANTPDSSTGNLGFRCVRDA